MPHSINFGRWLQRLGIKDGREPEIIRAIQPVQVVQDATGILSPLLPPSGLVGGSVTPAGGVFAAFEIYGGTRGGVAADTVIAQLGSTNKIAVNQGSTAFTLANLVTMTPIVYQQGQTASFRLGTIAAGGGNDDPQSNFTSNVASQPFPTFTPPGRWTLYLARAANLQTLFHCSWQEYESPPGPE